ncbi:hypothetical protein [Paracoccus tibetensis]|uniref:hypothetical protein n=1 Tax=Paracoccus tibetensis TaxID=336292 RepID=UPI00111423B4|nr:hypothetical protein [Paracoccus tibetensis]
MSIKVHDCIVFAADSASTLVDAQGAVQNVFNNADKVFNLHRRLPIAAMTCGMGHIAGRSISNLAKEFRRDLMNGLDEENYQIADVVQAAHSFFDDKYSAILSERGHGFDFFISGYGSDAAHGEVWKISIVAGTLQAAEQLQSGNDAGGINWGGQTSAIARLLLGVDPAIKSVLVDAGADPSVAEEVWNVARNGLLTGFAHNPMPTIDAIRLAEYLVDVTKGYFSFASGANIVGGATDIATVTRWEGFKWIKRKHFYPPELNRSQPDHVC